MVRSGGAAAASPALAGAAPPRGGAGRPGGPGAVPARVAGRRAGRGEPAAAPRDRGAGAPGRGGGPAGRPADPGVRPGAGRAAGARSRAISRASSTSWARSARSPGWGGGASAATTAGSCWSGPAGRSLRPAGSARRRRTRPAGPRHDAIRAHLSPRGASFYRELFTAAGGGSDREVLDALWDLVWAGEVTNDTFAPLRALRWKRTGSGGTRAPATGAADGARAARGGRPLVAGRGGGRSGQRHRAPPRD